MGNIREKTYKWYQSESLIRVMLKIKDKSSIRKISREAKIGYSYIIYLINYLEEKNMITTEKVGRERKICITESGRKVINLLQECEALFNNNERRILK